jgi:hypothetical protein
MGTLTELPAPEISVSGLSDRLPWHTVHHVHDPDGGLPPCTYSEGLATRPGRAFELATTGLGCWLALHVIEKTGEQLTDDFLDPAEGLELDRVLNGGYRVRLRRVGDPAFLSLPADTVVWQVLTPDKLGGFPGDLGYAEQWPQPLL